MILIVKRKLHPIINFTIQIIFYEQRRYFKRNKNSNLTEECKTEVIQIIEQYDKNRAEEILPLLFKLIEIAPTLIKLFCGHL